MICIGRRLRDNERWFCGMCGDRAEFQLHRRFSFGSTFVCAHCLVPKLRVLSTIQDEAGEMEGNITP